MATGSKDKTVKLWQGLEPPWRAVLGELGENVLCVAFAPDGKTLASGNGQYENRTGGAIAGQIKLWDASTGQKRHTLTGHTKEVRSIVFTADSGTVISGSEDTTIKLWDTSAGQEKRTLQGHMQGIRSVALQTNGRLLASASGEGDQPGELKLWDVNTGQQVAALSGHTSAINSVAFTPDGTTLASASDDGTLRLWNVATRLEIRKLESMSVPCTSVAFTLDGSTLGVRSPDGIDLWDMVTVTVKAKIKAKVERLSFLTFSPDSNFVVSGVSDSVMVWRLPKDGEPPQFAGQILAASPHGGKDYDGFEFGSAAFAPDGGLLACGNGTWIGNRGNVRLWEFADSFAEPDSKPELAKPNESIPAEQGP